jgi:hypothetical protein
MAIGGVADDGLSGKTREILFLCIEYSHGLPADIQPLTNRIHEVIMQKYWRDRAFELHRFIKAEGIQISRDNPVEMFGAFVTYFTRQELLDSYNGEDLMDLLQDVGGPKPYVILDDDLGVKRVAQLLNIPISQASVISQKIMGYFEELAPGQVFRDENAFIDSIVLPRIKQSIEASVEFAEQCSSFDSERIRIDVQTWHDSDEIHESLPRGARDDRQLIDKLRKLRDDKGRVWRFQCEFDLLPADVNGNVINGDKFLGGVTVWVDFEKLDRAIIASGEYQAKISGWIDRAWSSVGPFDPVGRPKMMLSINF